MTHASMTPVEALRVDAIQLSHTTGQVSIRSLDNDVIMIGHQAIGEAAPAKALAGLAQQSEKCAPVDVGLVDILAPVAARGHMIQSTRVFEA